MIGMCPARRPVTHPLRRVPGLKRGQRLLRTLDENAGTSGGASGPAISTVPPTRIPPDVGVTMQARAGQMMECLRSIPGDMICVL